MYIPIILGTGRAGNNSSKAAKFLFKQTLNIKGLKSEILDVKKFSPKFTDDSKTSSKAKKLARIIKKADALIIVSPEYNHSYPGELKLILDMLFTEYADKAIGLCGVSSGPWGGTRMLEQLKLLCLNFKMRPSSNELHFPQVQHIFNKQGKLQDPSYTDKTEHFLSHLMSMSKK